LADFVWSVVGEWRRTFLASNAGQIRLRRDCNPYCCPATPDFFLLGTTGRFENRAPRLGLSTQRQRIFTLVLFFFTLAAPSLPELFRQMKKSGLTRRRYYTTTRKICGAAVGWSKDVDVFRQRAGSLQIYGGQRRGRVRWSRYHAIVPSWHQVWCTRRGARHGSVVLA